MWNARRTGGALLALIGALGVAGSAYLEWLKNSQGSNPSADEMAFTRLFDSDASAMMEMAPAGWDGSYWESIALPLGIVAALGVIGAVLRSRIVLWLAFLVGLATAVLFVVFTFTAADNAQLDPGVSDLLIGFWLCVAALVVLLIGIFTMGGRSADEGPSDEMAAPSTADDALGNRPEI